MDTQHVTLGANAHDGSIMVHTETPVSADADTYLVNTEVTPQTKTAS